MSNLQELADEIIKAGTCDLMRCSMSCYTPLLKKDKRLYKKLSMATLEAIHSKAKLQMQKYFKEI